MLLYGFLVLFLMFVALGVVCETCDGLRSFIWTKFPGMAEIVYYDFSMGGESLLNISGIIWTVTAGFLFFVIQCGYGKKMGLEMYDILMLATSGKQLFLIISVIGLKLLVYGYSYIYEKKWILFLLPIEGMIALALIVWFMVHMTDVETIKELLQEHINNSLAQNREENFCKTLLKAAKGMKYDDNEENDALLTCIIGYLENMHDIKTQIEMGDWNREEVEKVKLQIITIEQLVDNIYAATKGKRRMLYVMQQCVLKMSHVDGFKTYLLFRSLISRSVYCLKPEDIKKVLESIRGEKQSEVVELVCCYLEFLKRNTTESAWAEILLNDLGGQRSDRSSTKEYRRMEYVEMIRYTK